MALKYEYTPEIESIFNPVQKWKYKADSPIFEQTFEEVSAMMLELMKLDSGEVIYDIGGIDFTVTFEDKEKWKQSFYLLNNRFEDFFLLIKKMMQITTIMENCLSINHFVPGTGRRKKGNYYGSRHKG